MPGIYLEDLLPATIIIVLVGWQFTMKLLIRKLSALVSPSGQETVIPIGVFACEKCGHVNAEFENMETT